MAYREDSDLAFLKDCSSEDFGHIGSNIDKRQRRQRTNV